MFFLTSIVDCPCGSFPQSNQTFLFLSKPAGITINTRDSSRRFDLRFRSTRQAATDLDVGQHRGGRQWRLGGRTDLRQTDDFPLQRQHESGCRRRRNSLSACFFFFLLFVLFCEITFHQAARGSLPLSDILTGRASTTSLGSHTIEAVILFHNLDNVWKYTWSTSYKCSIKSTETMANLVKKGETR